MTTRRALPDDEDPLPEHDGQAVPPRGATYAFTSRWHKVYDGFMQRSSDPSDGDTELAGIRRERDLYRKLLDLGAQEELEPFLEQALALMVEIAGARRGYIELYADSNRSDPPAFSLARGCSESEVAEIRALFSQSVIAEALATGKTIVTPSALEDPRFRDRGSVRRNQIEAALCVPIGTSSPLGVLYLQDRNEPGRFSEDDQLRAETFARHLAIFADRLLIRRRRRDETDATLAVRRRIRAPNVVGRSAALARMLEQVANAAPLEVGVLLTGPSGTGKTQIARVIHENGPRASKPFVELSCATLPESLVENELFGAVKGGHSAGPVEGKVAAAKGGTLFLDEIGELPLGAQAKLLQLLQSREYYSLGNPRPARADVRIIAATNVDLRAAVAQHRFREDLFYRLQVLAIPVPALSERREDVPELAAHFCAVACDNHRLPRLRLSVGALYAVETAEWPGNIRELAHAIEAAAIRAAGEGLLQIERRHIFQDEPGSISRDPFDEGLSLQQATHRFQEQLVRKALEAADWNIKDTAKRLDVARSHVYNLMKAHGIERRRS